MGKLFVFNDLQTLAHQLPYWPVQAEQSHNGNPTTGTEDTMRYMRTTNANLRRVMFDLDPFQRTIPCWF